MKHGGKMFCAKFTVETRPASIICAARIQLFGLQVFQKSVNGQEAVSESESMWNFVVVIHIPFLI